MKIKDKIINSIRESVYAIYPSATIILFGSVVRNADNKESDIDVLILLDEDNLSPLDKMKVTYPLYDIEFETGVIISLIVLTKKEWQTQHNTSPFYENVAKEGIIL